LDICEDWADSEAEGAQWLLTLSEGSREEERVGEGGDEERVDEALDGEFIVAMESQILMPKRVVIKQLHGEKVRRMCAEDQPNHVWIHMNIHS
jgi:hypothetical protein